MPWRVALALQSDGWHLRQDIIWAKPNPMPESVTDRCTKAHEYIFLLSKSARYYFDHRAIREPVKAASVHRLARAVGNQHKHSQGAPGQTPHSLSKPRPHCKSLVGRADRQMSEAGHRVAASDARGVNKRSVWVVSAKPYRGAHFATFPADLIAPCILAGSPAKALVLDPFVGSGTTAAVAKTLGRSYIGIDLNPVYLDLARVRIARTCVDAA